MSARTDRKIRSVIAVLILVTAAPTFAGKIIYVDDGIVDFGNIQAAIDAAGEGDEIIVSIGTYYENIGFCGKSITLRSTEPKNPVAVAHTIIDGRLGGSVVTFSGTESSACVLSGFTITNGRGTGVGYNYGGGIYGNGTLATIQNNIISGNRTASPLWPCSGFGGGIYDCDGTIQCNIISANFTSGNEGQALGGGLYGCDGIIRNNVISGNWASSGWGGYGGGIANCNGTIQNNTIFGNLARDYGGGLSSCNGTIINCIIWQNTAAEGAQIYSSSTPSYSCIQDWTGNLGGIGNIDDDPCFAGPSYWDTNCVWVDGDYHLLPASPCIDTGDPNYIAGPNETDLDGIPRVIGGRIDMGAYEAPVFAEARILSRTINITSKGKWITSYIWLPEDYNVDDIDPNSVFLEEQIKAEQLVVNEQEQVAIARFDREEVQSILEIGEIKLKITGRLTDGNLFVGIDVITVIDKGGGKSAKQQ